MLKNYFKLAWRNLLKNKVFSIVNTCGLAIGMAACFFIFEYTHFENSYDRWHTNAADIYRMNISFGGSFANLDGLSTNHPALGPAMKADFPEVVDFARVVSPSLLMSASTISYTAGYPNAPTTTFNEDKIYLADPSFLTMFTYPFLEGNPTTALAKPNTIVISGTAAYKYFGKQDPIGKTLKLNSRQNLTVTGVFKDVPENAHLRFDMLISFRSMGDRWGYDIWSWPEFYTYVQLKPGTDPAKLAAKFPAFTEKYLGDKMRELDFRTYFHLQPLTDIHLRSGNMKASETNGSEKEIWFLSLIGIFILVMAWINYINLSTAKSVERAKEVGLRKVVGARRFQVIGQFIIESVIINTVGLLLATIIVLFCFPFFSGFIGKDIAHGSISSGLWHAPGFWLALVAIYLVGALVVGAYPAFVLSAYKPSLVLKGKFFQSPRGILLRQSLVSFQFVLSILLIAGSLIVYRQLSYMRHQDLGYATDQTIVIKAPPIFDSAFAFKFKAFTTRLRTDPAVSAIAGSSDVPGRAVIGRNSIRRSSEDKTHNYLTNISEIDEHFLDAYHIELAAGRNLLGQDTINIYATKDPIVLVLINEKVARSLSFATNRAAVNQPIIFSYGSGELRGQIVGVIKNYHQRSLKEGYDPMLYLYPSQSDWRYFSIHLHTADMQREMMSIADLYRSVLPGTPFEYFFLDEYFGRQYAADQRFGKVFGLFTFLAIFVACLGLLGLSSFVIRLRTKEIGIRKVLGASLYSLLVLFSRSFVQLVGLASLFAIPVIYFMGRRWLSDYAFHIHMGWSTFLLPPLLLLAISLITICLQSLRAGMANPVKCLRTE
jgi:putative ABC transport system permease protein